MLNDHCHRVSTHLQSINIIIIIILMHTYPHGLRPDPRYAGLSLRMPVYPHKDKPVPMHSGLFLWLQVKCKVHPTTGRESPEAEYRFSTTLSLTSTIDGEGSQRHAQAALPRQRSRYPLYTRTGGPQGRSARVQKISLPPGFDPRTVKPESCRCAD